MTGVHSIAVPSSLIDQFPGRAPGASAQPTLFYNASFQLYEQGNAAQHFIRLSLIIVGAGGRE